MMRFFAKFYLWWNNICTKHFETKEFDPGGSYCKMCDAEKNERRRINVVNAITILKG